MAYSQHVNLIMEGVGAWNKWRAETKATKPDLSGINLCGHDLSEADLRHTNFANAALLNVNFAGVNLEHANFFSAKLAGADLRRCNLRGADLSRADLKGALPADTPDVSSEQRDRQLRMRRRGVQWRRRW